MGTAAPDGVFVWMCCCVRFRLASELLFVSQCLYVFFSFCAKLKPSVATYQHLFGDEVPPCARPLPVFPSPYHPSTFFAPPDSEGA